LERPKALQERIFKKFFDVAEIGNLSKEEYAKYFESEKVYYDNDGANRTAEAKGIAKGREEGRAEGEQKKAFDIARNLLQMGMSSAQVSEVTGLTIEKIETL
jgi:predicted transposase/invertase (TIGR01784 family)